MRHGPGRPPIGREPLPTGRKCAAMDRGRARTVPSVGVADTVSAWVEMASEGWLQRWRLQRGRQRWRAAQVMTGARRRTDFIVENFSLSWCDGRHDRRTAFTLQACTTAVCPFRPRQDHPLAEFALARKRSAVECFAACATKLFPV
jgi:hypothetical protein